jgi:hypothetical protein
MLLFIINGETGLPKSSQKRGCIFEGGVGNLFEASSYICNKERKNIVELTLT